MTGSLNIKHGTVHPCVCLTLEIVITLCILALIEISALPSNEVQLALVTADPEELGRVLQVCYTIGLQILLRFVLSVAA